MHIVIGIRTLELAKTLDLPDRLVAQIHTFAHFHFWLLKWADFSLCFRCDTLKNDVYIHGTLNRNTKILMTQK